MIVQKKVKVYLRKRNLIPVIDVVQYDTGIRLVLECVDENIPTGSTATAFFEKPSKLSVFQTASVSGNTITVDCHNQAFTEEGAVLYQVELSGGDGKKVTTFAGKIDVQRRATENAIPSQTVIPALEAAVNDIAEDLRKELTGKVKVDYSVVFRLAVSDGVLTDEHDCASIVVPVEAGMNYDMHFEGKFNRALIYGSSSADVGSQVTSIMSEFGERTTIDFKYKNDDGFNYIIINISWNYEYSVDKGLVLEIHKKDESASALYVSASEGKLVTSTAALLNLYNELMSKNSDYVKKNALGQNSEGTDIYEYVFDSGDNNGGSAQRNKDTASKKPCILIVTGVHGEERSSVMSTYLFAKDLCEYNDTLYNLRENYTIKIIPVVCPWGFDKGSRVNENGVNLNRNFSKYWVAGGSGTGDYAGASAADQKETQVVQAWITANPKALLYIDFHNSGYSEEVAYLAGTNSVEGMNDIKGDFLRRQNELKCRLIEKEDFAEDLKFAYTGSFPQQGMSYFYAEDKGLKAICLEASWNQNSSGKDSEVTIRTGAEILGNFVNAFVEDTEIKESVQDLVPKDYEQLKKDVTDTKEDFVGVRALLQQVRDALQNGDIDEAISLLDTFLLGQNGGVLR